jgi:hypothetical protein
VAEDKKGPPSGGKKDSKKGDSKSAPPAVSDLSVPYQILFWMIILAGMLKFLFMVPGLSSFVFGPNKPDNAVLSFFYSDVGTSETRYDIGSEVKNFKEVLVMDSPLGEVVGTQKRGVIGFVRSDVVEFGGESYIRINYENGSDGWVNVRDLGGSTLVYGIFSTISFIYKIIIVLGSIFSLIFLIGIIYARRKSKEIESRYKKILEVVPEETTPQVRNEKWERVLAHINSQNSSDWRLAILEADIILEELLGKMNYDGQTIGDRLKNIEKSDFLNLDNAWEAHKVRNEIAHKGADFMISQREAQRVVGLYEQVFKELHFI